MAKSIVAYIVFIVGCVVSVFADGAEDRINVSIISGKVISGFMWDGGLSLWQRTSNNADLVEMASSQIMLHATFSSIPILVHKSTIYQYNQEHWYTNSISYAVSVISQRTENIEIDVEKLKECDSLYQAGIPIKEEILGINLKPSHLVETDAKPIVYNEKLPYPSGWLISNLFLSDKSKAEGFTSILYRDLTGTCCPIAIVSFNTETKRALKAHRFDLDCHLHPYFDSAGELCVYLVKGKIEELIRINCSKFD